MRFLDLTLPTIEENIALDEALLVEVEAGLATPILRIWELDHVAVVLGASGRLHQDVFVERCQANDVPIARRSSGGGTVVIGPGALNFAVVLSRDFAPGLDAVDLAQCFVLKKVAAGLQLEGHAVEVLGSGDLTIDRRKVSGSAQRRLKHHFLVHATILYDFPLEWIGRCTQAPEKQPAYREDRSHEDFVANLEISRNGLIEVLKKVWDANDPSAVEAPIGAMRNLVKEKFADPAWIGRL